MKAIHHKTIHLSGNIIDLDELRRCHSLAQQDSLARQPQGGQWALEEGPAFHPVVLTATPEERRRARRERRAWRLDACASLAVIVVTVLLALRMLI